MRPHGGRRHTLYSGAGKRRADRGAIPEFPGGIATRVDLFELLTILEGVHRHPEAVVLIGRETPIANQAMERFADELFSLADVIEDLAFEDEVAAVDPER